MAEKIGRLGGRFCTLFALCACLLILALNGLFLFRNRQFLSVVSFLLAAAVLFCAVRFLPCGRVFPIALFFVRFFCALAVILVVGSQPLSDFETMYTAAVQLANGSHEYLQLSTQYFHNWAYQSAFVAYESIVLTICGEGYLPLQILNAVYLSGTTVLVYYIGKQVMPEKAAMGASILYAIYPAPLLLAGVLTNQHLSVFLVYLSVYLILSDKKASPVRMLSAGALLALAKAIRPNCTVVLLAVVLFCIIRLLVQREGKSFRAWLRPVAVVGSYLAVFSLLSAAIVITGVNPDGLANHQPMWMYLEGFNEETRGSFSYDDYHDYYLLQGEAADTAMREELEQRLSVGPVRLAKLMAYKCYVMWGENEYTYWGFWHLEGDTTLIGPLTAGQVQNLLAYFDKGVYVLAFGLAFVGLLRRLREGGQTAAGLLPVIILCGYFSAYLLVEVQSRYRYCTMPAVFLLAGMGLSAVIRQGKTDDLTR